MVDKTVLLPIAIGAGGLLGGLALGQGMTQQVYNMVAEANTGKIDFATLLKKLYNAYWKSDPDAAGLAYWQNRYTDPADTEFTTNLFTGSSVAISQSGTKPAILAVLVLRNGL